MWHQLLSTAGVASTASASPAASPSPRAVISAVGSAAVRAARIALMVAAVPASWETPITQPSDGGSSSSSNASAELAAWPASRRIEATAIDACSLVPQPVTVTGEEPRSSSATAAVSSPVAIRSSSSGSESIISSITHGGPERSSGKASVSHSGRSDMRGVYGVCACLCDAAPLDNAPLPWYPGGDVRRLLAVLTLAALGSAMLSAQTGSAAPACTATATGGHTRSQVIAVALSSGCPATGSQKGNLRYAQFPGISALGGYTINFATRRLALTLPTAVAPSAAYTALHTDVGLQVQVSAAPARQVSGDGRYAITGGFTASNGAVIHWTQRLAATPVRVGIGAIKVTATFPGARSMLIQVRQSVAYCATSQTCPFGASSRVESFTFPAAYTHASLSSGAAFQTGTDLLWGSEEPSIVLRDRVTGRILGRSDLGAVVRSAS